MSSKPFTARFAEGLVDRLTARSDAVAVSRSKLAEQYIEEGLRMDAHPGIVFRDGPSGRRAAIAGGMDVWEMIATVKDQSAKGEQAIDETASYLEVSPVVVRTAVGYYAEFKSEIDDSIERNRAEADAAEAAWRDSLVAIS